MLSPAFLVNLGLCGMILAALFVIVFLAYLDFHYGHYIERIFQERPVFLPLRVTPEDTGEAVRFTTEDGLVLRGSYLRRRAGDRVGVLVFCHEYLSDRWSYLPYLDHLRDAGYDIFSFDFRDHGLSESDPSYAPLQWATDHEVRDLKAALACLRARPDHDAAGFGLFGVSRGGSTALVVAAESHDVWGVITDGAFPTRGTMTAYIMRWAEIYVHSQAFLAIVPRWVYDVLGWTSRRRSQHRLNCRFPAIERAAKQLSPRPWLMIHGQRDTYIGPDIAQELFAHAREPKQLWLVPDAKHNRCRDCEPEAYTLHLSEFLVRYAPRGPRERTAAEVTLPRVSAAEPAIAKPAGSLLGNVAASVSS